MSFDSWISEQEDLERQSFELFQKINARNQLPKNGLQFTRLDGQILQNRKKYDERIGRLQQQLVQLSVNGTVTRSEAERRQRLLDSLTTKARQMESSLAEPNATSRNALFGQYGATGSRNVWSDDDEIVPASSNLTNDDLRQQHKQLFKEQDRGLEVLDEIITRQKNLARGIGTEIDIQNEIIEDIGDNMDQTNERLIRNTRNIKKVSRKSDTCTYWVVIILLLVAIIVVAAW